ncbi:hypothetical protein QNA23_20390 [Rhodococcus erythropolis]|uniref:hypothetical protein n=1 Tax=Rhodococcus erythropolis TaxID=1833 RepID=UPI0024B9A274|nr:hypothetical protein [Rhodococcus erythropolis]MDJ0405864.1 hypothetical protein [Rhodococcus erythropolis]
MTQQIPYDEMRRLCRLPSKEYLDTLADLERYGLKYVLIKKITSSQPWWVPVDEPSIESLEIGIAPIAGNPKQAPPMWANDPAHTRRTAFGPTKRVK